MPLTLHKDITVTEKEKLGRNQPCYCGSGKKYKKCCLKKDRAQEREREARFSQVNNNQYIGRVVGWLSDQEWFTQILDQRLSEFFSKETRIREEALSALIETIIFEDSYQGRPVLEHLIEHADLDPEERRRYQAWLEHSFFSLFKVTEVSLGESLTIVDLFDQQHYIVPEHLGSLDLESGQHIFTRLIPEGDHFLISGGMSVVYPADPSVFSDSEKLFAGGRPNQHIIFEGVYAELKPSKTESNFEIFSLVEDQLSQQNYFGVALLLLDHFPDITHRKNYALLLLCHVLSRLGLLDEARLCLDAISNADLDTKENQRLLDVRAELDISKGALKRANGRYQLISEFLFGEQIEPFPDENNELIRDLETFLEYVKQHKPAITKKNKWLTLKHVTAINAMFISPDPSFVTIHTKKYDHTYEGQYFKTAFFHYFCLETGYIKRRKQRLSLTQNGQKILDLSRAEKNYEFLLEWTVLTDWSNLSGKHRSHHVQKFLDRFPTRRLAQTMSWEVLLLASQNQDVFEQLNHFFERTDVEQSEDGEQEESWTLFQTMLQAEIRYEVLPVWEWLGVISIKDHGRKPKVKLNSKCKKWVQSHRQLLDSVYSQLNQQVSELIDKLS